MAVGTTAAEGRLLGMYGKKSRGSKILATSWRGDFVKFYLALPKMRVAPQMPSQIPRPGAATDEREMATKI